MAAVTITAQDLRHEGQRHLLDLGQGLDEGDADADHHGGENGRARGDDHGPDRGLLDVEGVRLIHSGLGSISAGCGQAAADLQG